VTSPRARLIAFAVVVVIAVGVSAGYLMVALRYPPDPVAAQSAPSTSSSAGSGTATSYIAFRRTKVDAAYGTVGTVPLDEPDAAPTSTPLSCERIHMSPYGGVCLEVDRGAMTTAKVLLLWPDMTVRHTLQTAGVPSRARVSPDGRWAATTTFVSGHSYTSSGFSTQTEIYDMETGTSLGNVEKFHISHRGKLYEATDVNVWGVTFAADGSTFYATVMTGGTRYLAQGDTARRTLVMLDVPAECPSLSPDGKLLAYKSATGPITWQVRVRTLANGSERVVDESSSVDDQIEWLDDEDVVFGLPRPEGGATSDIWVAPADGSGPARLLITGAWSPAVVRTG
jgi:Tol biopolymer transport system component